MIGAEIRVNALPSDPHIPMQKHLSGNARDESTVLSVMETTGFFMLKVFPGSISIGTLVGISISQGNAGSGFKIVSPESEVSITVFMN